MGHKNEMHSNDSHFIGIVGFGGMAKWHEELIRDIENLEVAGVYDIKEERMAFADSIGLDTYGTLEAMLADEKVELILVAAPNDIHKPVAIQAMRAGKHVICEKPVTLSSSDLREMTDVAKETGMFLTVHQNRRWDEDYLTVKKLVEENRQGELFRIESRVHGSIGIPGDWRQEPEKGGGMVLDWGVHLLDQMLLLFPGQKVKKVYATLTHVTNQLVDDGFFVELAFENGVAGVVEVGTSNFISLPRWYVLWQNGTALIKDWDSDCKIVAANGKNKYDVVPVKTAAGLTKTMAPRREDSISTQELPKVTSDIRDFYKNVMEVLEQKAEPVIKIQEVERVMRLMETIFKSAEKQQVLDFE